MGEEPRLACQSGSLVRDIGKSEDSKVRENPAGRTAWLLSLDVAEEEEPTTKGKTDGGSSKFLLPQDCVEDSVRPITLRLNFSLVGDSASSRNLRPVLAVGSQDHITASVSNFP